MINQIETLQTLTSDVNFLLVLTGISILLGTVASVIAIGNREELKDFMNSYNKFVGDYNDLVQKHNKLTDIVADVSKCSEQIEKNLIDLGKKYNKTNDAVKAMACGMDDAFEAHNVRLNQLEFIKRIDSSIIESSAEELNTTGVEQ